MDNITKETEDIIKRLLDVTLNKNQSFLLRNIELKIKEEINNIVENDIFIKNEIDRIIFQNLETIVKNKMTSILKKSIKTGHVKNLINNTIFQELNKIKFDEKIKINFNDEFIRNNIIINDDIFPSILKERYSYLVENSCCVCYENTKRKTKCDHLLCYECENSLITKSCPYCRNNLNT